MTALVVEAISGSATVQDAGRPGRRAETIGLSGAADQSAWRLGNRLVGNRPGAAGIECTFASIELRSTANVVVAVTGAVARVNVVGVDGRLRRGGGQNAALVVPAGDRLVIDAPTDGLRTYIAVRGGIDVVEVLGSRSWDSLAQFGPPPLVSGAVLAIGDEADERVAPFFDPLGVRRADRSVCPVYPGPHHGMLDRAAVERLQRAAFTVGQRCDRVGVQLDDVVQAGLPGNLASFPIVPGCIQLPPDGRPIILGRDCGATGGYPVIGVVPLDALDLVAQLRPGDRFRWLLR